MRQTDGTYRSAIAPLVFFFIDSMCRAVMFNQKKRWNFKFENVKRLLQSEFVS